MEILTHIIQFLAELVNEQRNLCNCKSYILPSVNTFSWKLQKWLLMKLVTDIWFMV